MILLKFERFVGFFELLSNWHMRWVLWVCVWVCVYGCVCMGVYVWGEYKRKELLRRKRERRGERNEKEKNLCGVCASVRLCVRMCVCVCVCE